MQKSLSLMVKTRVASNAIKSEMLQDLVETNKKIKLVAYVRKVTILIKTVFLEKEKTIKRNKRRKSLS